MVTLTKYQLAAKYGISPSSLRSLMNKVYYDELVAEGYVKRRIILSPRVVAKFVDLYGEPINHLEGNKK